MSLEELLQAVFGLNRSEAARRLESLCPDAVLRQRAFDVLEANDEPAPPTTRTEDVGGSEQPDSDGFPGMRSAGNRYRVRLDKAGQPIVLGRGGSATVLLADDRLFPGRPIALKHFVQQGTRAARVVGEAAAQAEIHSDHVLRVHDVVRFDGRPTIVMERLSRPGADESSAADLSNPNRPPDDLAQAVTWLIQAARGIADAHQLDIFHRDVKPANVMLDERGRQPRAVVTDFGLATLSLKRQGPGAPVVGESRGGVIAGTPEYMAPEQAVGLPADLDPKKPEDRAVLVQVDVYGLGALGYELITGRPPFIFDDALGRWGS